MLGILYRGNYPFIHGGERTQLPGRFAQFYGKSPFCGPAAIIARSQLCRPLDLRRLSERRLPVPGGDPVSSYVMD